METVLYAPDLKAKPHTPDLPAPQHSGWELKETTCFYAPPCTHWEEAGIHFFVDGEKPHWIACDERGAWVMAQCQGIPFPRLLAAYRERYGEELGRSWIGLRSFLRSLVRAGFLSLTPPRIEPYPGRSYYLELERLEEFWIHFTQICNLRCTHCLVSSGPEGERGLSLEELKRIAGEAYELGARRFYLTGGEPFARQDIGELLHFLLHPGDTELVILSNATLFASSRGAILDALPPERVKFQVSLDGATPQVNDAIRGKGVFARTSEGIRTLVSRGFPVSLTAVVTKQNLHDLEQLPDLAASLGVPSLHLLWPHRRGRIIEEMQGYFPSLSELKALVASLYARCKSLGIVLDNIESLRQRVEGPPGIKYDLSGSCWESLCLYSDGWIYPSPAMAGHKELRLGNAREDTLERIWRESDLAIQFRQASVAKKEELRAHPLRYFTGGGDLDHSYFYSANGKPGDLLAPDPYHPLYEAMVRLLMRERAQEERALTEKNPLLRGGPVLYHTMGEGSIRCSEDALRFLAGNESAPVKLLHTNCVLAFDVEKPYRLLQRFYGNAAVTPQAELCCPVKYEESEISHIPQEVVERFYGCGSPVTLAAIQPGETVVDLGSGAGIDCFIAAKKVGAKGRVIGVDMTEEMLTIARDAARVVAERLGYTNVEFRKGYLEKIPVEEGSVDLVTSNCVINLSPDKERVFQEIFRILKDGGRLVVSDIVADRPVPLGLQAHRDLWGECISGALSEEEFLELLERTGFYGVTLLRKRFWKEVEGYRFYSLTVRAFRYEKKQGCRYLGHRAVYLGPGKAFMDEEGHLFPRGEAVLVCTDTVAKLKSGAYGNSFLILAPGEERDLEQEPLNYCCEGEGCC